MKKNVFTIAMLTALFLISCKETPKQENSETNEGSTIEINAKDELGKWKKQLIDSKQLGNPCNFESVLSTEAQKWKKDNAGQINGLPNDTEISTINADFDGDNKQDLLMYFNSENCSGHNGGTPSFAKIVYANNTSYAELMKDIKQSIITEYKAQIEKNPKMKEISDSYMDESLTFLYKNGITGEFKLYTKDDAHCCPSYNGNYVYNVKDKKLNLTISENKK
jgi:hypothetical protein